MFSCVLVGPDAHRIVEDDSYGFRCVKCELLGPSYEPMLAIPCCRHAADEAMALALMEEELAMLQAMEAMEALIASEHDVVGSGDGSAEPEPPNPKIEAMPPPPVPKKVVVKKRKDTKKDENPFDLPPDHDQRRLEDLGCLKRKASQEKSALYAPPVCAFVCVNSIFYCPYVLLIAFEVIGIEFIL